MKRLLRTVTKIRWSQIQASLIAVMFVFISSFPTISAFAAPLTADDRRSINNDTFHYKGDYTLYPGCSPDAAGGGLVGEPTSIYVLGDSLTVGMRDSGAMGDKLTAAHWAPTKINAVGGRNLDWGIEQLTADQTIVNASNAVLIALGTNNIGDVVTNAAGGNLIKSGSKDRMKNKMQQIVNLVREKPDMRIYWTNFYGEGTLTSGYGTFDLVKAYGVLNEALTEVAAANAITILPWAGSQEAQQFVPNNDVHPNGHYPEMATFIVGRLGTEVTTPASPAAPGAAATCCVVGGSVVTGTPAVGDDNQTIIWNYFIAQGLGDIAVAAIMGNFQRESNFNPAAVNSIGATGIAQWLYGRKTNLQNYAQTREPRNVFDLLTQLDFSWGELNGPYRTSVLEPLRTAGTLETAVDIWTRKYEVPGHYETEIPTRLGYAQEALTRFGGGGPAVAPSSCPAAPGSVSPPGQGDIVGSDGVFGWDLPGEGSNPMRYFYSQICSYCTPFPGAYTDFYGLGEGKPGGINIGTGGNPRTANSYLYGSSGGTLQAGGCGPTSVAQVISNLTGNKVGADEIGQWFVTNHWQFGGGSNSGAFGTTTFSNLMTEKYQVRSRRLSQGGHNFSNADADLVAAELKKGNFVIGSFDNTSPVSTASGSAHIITIRAVTADGRFLFADTGDSNTKNRENGPIRPAGVSRTPLTPAQIGLINTGLYVFERAE